MKTTSFGGWWAGWFGLGVAAIQLGGGSIPVPSPGDPSVPAARVAVPPKPAGAHPIADGRDGGSAALSWSACLAMPEGLRDDCFEDLAWQRSAGDLVGALEACAQVAPARSEPCRADVAEGHALTDRDAAFALCETLEARTWHDQCYFGIALAFVAVEAERAFAVATCERAGMWTRFCRHDVNGERAVHDLAAATAYCDALAPGDRPSCWHGVGKYAARARGEQGFAACAGASTQGDRLGQCVHGVGWALAEARGLAAAEACVGRAAEDACRMGVAYHVKRFDPVGAEDLCGEVVDGSERARCLEVVRRRMRVREGAPVP